MEIICAMYIVLTFVSSMKFPAAQTANAEATANVRIPANIPVIVPSNCDIAVRKPQ